MKNIVSNIANSIGKELLTSISMKDVVSYVFGKDGIIPVLDRDIWIANFRVSASIKDSEENVL